MGHQLQVKGLSDEVREHLQASADWNFRSLNQEALARIQFSFEIEDSLHSKQLQKLVNEVWQARKRVARQRGCKKSPPRLDRQPSENHF